MSVITHKFWPTVETSPVNSTFLTNNSLFVIFKLIIYSSKHLCFNRTSLSDMLMFRKGCDVFYALMAGRGANAKRNNFVKSFQRFSHAVK
jgi:hypothetical protein